ncbi:MAG: flagellar biosynthesis protein FlhB [Gemmatimonadota bacterium]|nr:flagellar biosynthesis protein FlhB [Gemmatimonadota bacterium]
MADDGQERTEEATPKKRQDAHEEGKIPKSQELTTAILLLGTALTLNVAGVQLCKSIASLFGYGLTASGQLSQDGSTAITYFQYMGGRALLALVWFMLSMMGISLGISTLQARGVLSMKPLGPNWGKLNPLENAKRMLGVQSIAELVKSLAKLLIVGSVVYKALTTAMPDILALSQQTPLALLMLVKHYSVKMLMMAGLSYLSLALVDYAYQLWQHEKTLKMSRQEVKMESKQSDGDPMVKQRMRTLARAKARKSMMQDVPRADVVITNPTHIAVALIYDPDNAPAPIVVAMGQRKIAQRIKQIAFENGVPVIENKPVARALFASAKLGTMIPAELYLAVAEILAFVLKQRALAPRRWKGATVGATL